MDIVGITFESPGSRSARFFSRLHSDHRAAQVAQRLQSPSDDLSGALVAGTKIPGTFPVSSRIGLYENVK